MDQIISARRSLKRKQLEAEFQDQYHPARKALVVEDPNKDVQTNSTNSSSMAAPSSSESCWDYDVFLSFRGEDTRRNFTDHLYSALKRIGIRTFRDDEELQRGENISTKLLHAIQRSRIFIVIFSKGYASSRWCLDELVEMVHCENTIGHTLFPIFYHVDPSDVRNQTGTFAEAFARHAEQFQTNIERVQKWREALTKAANCSGWILESVANGHESRFIEEIVKEVLLHTMNLARLKVAMNPVGIDSRVKEMKDLLDLETHDIVSIVGIYGMGGIGKTTLAKAIYNQICDGFEGSSYLLNVKETSGQPNGLVSLQKQLLFDVLKMNLMISNIARGIELIENKCQGKKVLIVMDDMDDVKQLHTLVGNSKWFGPGSRIIATTRDEQLLTQLGVHKKYKVEKLNCMESLRLFSYHAFKMPDPTDDYQKLSILAVEHAQGLPLALEVLGSYLLGKSVSEWEGELEELQIFPHKEIQKILRLSYESLEYPKKQIFLDIACFFIGMKKDHAIKILHGCDFFPKNGISVLIQRSLVTIDIEMKLRMHDLIRDMAREIVQEKSPDRPGKRTRLWFHDDVLNVLSKHTGSDKVQGLILNLPALGDKHLETEAFVEMKNLRLLQINAVSLTGCYKHLPKDLRWLCWNQCPLKFLPLDFHLENLVVLDMEHSNVKQIWNDNRVLNKLKVLNLSYSKNLIKSPNFLRVPRLEMLILEGCINLVELHESIGHLKHLVLLNLNECNNLRNLPRSISNLVSLERLNFSGPTGRFPQSWLSSFSSWISPKSLLRASVFGFFYLGKLVLSNSNLFEDDIAIDLERLYSLQFLDLSYNNFRNLPYCISRLPKLKFLILNHCMSLESISGLPVNVMSLLALGCSSMERLSILPGSKIGLLFLVDCCKLVEIQGFPLDSGGVFNLFGCYNMSSDFRASLLKLPSTKHDCVRFTFLPGSEVPNWFTHQRIGSSISFDVPSISSRVPSLSEDVVYILFICAVYAKEDESDRLIKFSATVDNKSRGYRQVIVPTTASYFANKSDHLFLVEWHLIRRDHALMLVSPGREMELLWKDEIEVSFDISSADMKTCVVKKCGVHLRVDEPTSNP